MVETSRPRVHARVKIGAQKMSHPFSEHFGEDFNQKIQPKIEVFSRELHRRSKSHYEELGRFVHCHLLIEDLLTKIIKNENPKIGEIENARLTFMTKLKLVRGIDRGYLFNGIDNAIVAINNVRNNLSHKLEYIQIDDSQLDPVRECLSSVDREYGSYTGLKLIEHFTFSFFMLVTTFHSAKELVNEARENLQKIKDEMYEETFKKLSEIFEENNG